MAAARGRRAGGGGKTRRGQRRARVDERHPPELVRNDGVRPLRVEPDVPGAPSRHDGADQIAGFQVEHEDLAVGQGAHVHLRVVGRDGHVEGVAPLSAADRVLEEGRVLRREVADQDLAALDVSGEEQRAVARDGDVLDAGARDGVPADDGVAAQIHRGDRSRVASRDVHARRDRMERHSGQQVARRADGKRIDHLTGGCVDDVDAVEVGQRVETRSIRREPECEDTVAGLRNRRDGLVRRDIDVGNGVRVLVIDVRGPTIGAHTHLRGDGTDRKRCGE